jgi:hypothetical protein
VLVCRRLPSLGAYKDWFKVGFLTETQAVTPKRWR